MQCDAMRCDVMHPRCSRDAPTTLHAHTNAQPATEIAEEVWHFEGLIALADALKINSSLKLLENSNLPHGPPVVGKDTNAQYEASAELRNGSAVFVIELRRAGIPRRTIVATMNVRPRT